MTEPKSKDEILSVGAKTYIEDLAKEFVYGYVKEVTSKEMEKGLIVEQACIDLLNEVLFTSFTKNTERRENEWLTGECDIFTGRKIHDIKAPWSLATFPATVFAGRDRDYEWQLRGYMMLWNVDESEIDYCMVSTPDELIRYEPEAIHYVDHIDPMLRVTRVPYARDKALEDKIKRKVDVAREYFEQIAQTIAEEHA
ncbi:hypothetical protein [Paraburkholderia sp. BL9I2N2]|uniref:hypothetical protein n=1 Tax=Paraburkholderia sp. BL9I2N2 TaxID=1938809 RepID=UPI001FB33E1B|nr:hypothetical protein [Paraburkholderia sp. BL9I2N2]